MEVVEGAAFGKGVRTYVYVYMYVYIKLIYRVYV